MIPPSHFSQRAAPLWTATCLFTLCLLLSLGAPRGAEAESIRGITISTHTNGHDWGFDSMGPTLDDLVELGADWVSIHPYAWIGGDGEVRFHPIDLENPPAYLVRPIAEAQARGMKILIKPHLGYWRSPFRWRGEIEFEDPAAWERFWTSYRSWIVNLAQACHEADGFVVGTELDRMLHFEDEWRGIIREIRASTDFALTYAANWSDYQRVGFWDALDVIGIQAYFPLAEHEQPSTEELRAGWERVMAELHEFSESRDRNVVFTELGYARSFSAALRPWEGHRDGPEAAEFQAACLRVALQAVEREPRVLGSFLWKWFPRPHSMGRNFQLAAPAMQGVIQECWGEPDLAR